MGFERGVNLDTSFDDVNGCAFALILYLNDEITNS